MSTGPHNSLVTFGENLRTPPSNGTPPSNASQHVGECKCYRTHHAPQLPAVDIAQVYLHTIGYLATTNEISGVECSYFGIMSKEK